MRSKYTTIAYSREAKDRRLRRVLTMSSMIFSNKERIKLNILIKSVITITVDMWKNGEKK